MPIPSPTIRTYTLAPDEKEAVLRRAADALRKEEAVLFAYAHGSFLENRPFRDLDLAVYVRPERMQAGRTRFETGLEASIRKALDSRFPVDVRELNRSGIPFQYHAIRGRLLVDRDPETRWALMTWVVARYLDLEPILRHHTKEAFAHAAGS